MIRVLNFFCVALMGLSILALYHVSEQTRVAHMRAAPGQPPDRPGTRRPSACWRPNGSMSPRPPASSSWPQRQLGMTDSASVQLSSFDQLPRRGDDRAAEQHARCTTPAPRCRPRRSHAADQPGHVRRMSEAPTIFQRRIVIGAVFCVAAFALVGIRLVDVTLLQAAGQRPRVATAVDRPRRSDRPQRRAPGARPAGQGSLCPPACLLGQGTKRRTIWPRPPAPTSAACCAGFNNAKHPYVLVARQLTPDDRGQGDASGPAGSGVRAQRQALLSRRPHRRPASGRHRSRQQRRLRPGAGPAGPDPRRRRRRAGHHLHRHAGAIHPGA